MREKITSMTPTLSISIARLQETLTFVNALRRRVRDDARALDAAERIASALFGAGERLAVYGSLIPGKENHHLVSSIGGMWSTGYFEGKFYERGWGAGLGYPAARWMPGGAVIPAHVLTASSLPEHWRRLDDFEGSDYRRILVPVFLDAGSIVVCNLYELHVEET